MEKEKSRMINCNFPARALIIDTASPSCSDVVENICIALTNVFAMISELPGQCRVPTCSLFMTGSRNECLFPLQPIKGNFLKLYMSIEELKIQNCHDQSLVHSKEILKRAINEAVSQFKRWSLTMKTGQRIGNTCQVEICIITCKKQNVLESDLAEAFPGFDFEVLKKIQVINVEQLECCLDDKMKNASLDCDKSNDTDALHEYIEFNSLSNDVTAFEQTFKSWIIDIGSDDVHLTIDLPSSSPKEGGIQLKCDLEDRFLNPLDLPHCQRMFMRTGFQNCPTINQQSRKMNSSVPIAHVFALKWIKASGVCESLGCLPLFSLWSGTKEEADERDGGELVNQDDRYQEPQDGNKGPFQEELEFIVYNGQIIDYEDTSSALRWATNNAGEDDGDFNEYGSDSKDAGKDDDKDINDENGNDESGDKDNHNEDQNNDGGYEELEFIVYNGQRIDYEDESSTLRWAINNADEDDGDVNRYGSDSKDFGSDDDEVNNDENTNDENGNDDSDNRYQESQDGNTSRFEKELEFVVYNGQIIDYEDASPTLRWAINNASEDDGNVNEYEMYCERCECEYEDCYDADVSQSESGENRERSSLAENVVYKKDNEEDINMNHEEHNRDYEDKFDVFGEINMKKKGRKMFNLTKIGSHTVKEPLSRKHEKRGMFNDIKFRAT
eukprot:gene12948-14280_t